MSKFKNPEENDENVVTPEDVKASLQVDSEVSEQEEKDLELGFDKDGGLIGVIPEEEKKEEEIPMINDIQTKFFEGKEVISEGTRTVNDKPYHVIRLADGSTYDLTYEEYKLKIILE